MAKPMNNQGNNRPLKITGLDPFFVKRAITMKSLHWVLITAFLLILKPLTQASELDSITLNSKLVPGKVEVSVLLPPGFNRRSKPHKLLLWLHGGGQDSSYLDRELRPIVERAWEEGHLPQLVVAVPSARRSFYMDYRDGSEKWETLILKELLPALQSKYGLRKDQRGTLIGGYSMGGMGSLRIAFEYPDRFAAVAAIAPAIEPVYKFNEIQPVDRVYRNNGIYEKIFGDPVDQDYWQANHPPAIARDRSNILIASKMKIYFEVGDADSLGLYRGGEFLHRLLLDKGVKHEYRLVHGADHNDTSIPARLSDAVQFLGRCLEDRETTDTATSQLDKEVKAHMERYVELFNNEQAEAIAGEIYLAPVLIWKSGDENQSVALTAEEIHEQFNSTYKTIKANGWNRSVIHGMDIRIGGEDLAFVDMRFSRLMADGKPIPPEQRTVSYVLVKRETGWRIISAHGQSAASSAAN